MEEQLQSTEGVGPKSDERATSVADEQTQTPEQGVMQDAALDHDAQGEVTDLDMQEEASEAEETALASATQTQVLPRHSAPRMSGLAALSYLLRGDLLGLFDTASRLGTMVRLDQAFFRLYQVNDAQLIQEVLLDRQKNYRKGRLMRRLAAVTGEGLLINDGELWRRHRRLASPAFSPRSLDGYAAAMIDSVEGMLVRWDALEPGTSVEVLHAMSEVTLIGLLRSLFGVPFDERFEDVSVTINDLLDAVVRRGSSLFPLPLALPTPANRRFREHIGRVNRVLEGIIDSREKALGTEPAEDLLGQWLQTSQEDPDRFSPQELRDELMTMLIAGHHSLAIALAWSLYEIARDETVQARVVAEVSTLSDPLPSDLKGLKQLPYTRGVFLEALRFYPQPPILLRDALVDHALGGFRVRKGDQLVLNLQSVHMHPDLWPEPERFLPERYSTLGAEALARKHYLSFGGGSRSCIGRRFAILEGCLLLARILRRFRLELRDPNKLATPRFAAMVIPMNDLELSIFPRESQS